MLQWRVQSETNLSGFAALLLPCRRQASGDWKQQKKHWLVKYHNVPLLHSLAILSNTHRETTDASCFSQPRRTEQPSDTRPFVLSLINTWEQEERLPMVKSGTKNQTGILLMISQGKRVLRQSLFTSYLSHEQLRWDSGKDEVMTLTDREWVVIWR